MADDGFQERTEQATPRRRQEARNEGRIPKSQEVGSAFGLLTAGLALGPAVKISGDALQRFFRESLVSQGGMLGSTEWTAGWMRGSLGTLLMSFVPLLVTLAAVGLLIAALQARGTLTTKPLEVNWERLAPWKNLKRFVGIKPFVELLKALLKVGLVGLVIWFVLDRAWADLIRLPQTSPGSLLSLLSVYVIRVLVASALALMALAGADYAYQVWQHEKELKMTREEVKKELRETEGDPFVKARLRQLGRSLARMRMMAEVPTADVVVTNPTHIAVALRYDISVSPAPVVVAMGARKTAERIKKIAAESGVPVVENKPLARALFKTAEVGGPVPPALYIAVAEVLAFVIRHGLGRARRLVEVRA